MQGIMFLEPMFLAAIAGTKTQTRRLIFPKTDYTFWSQPSFEGMETDPDDVIKRDKNGDIICYKDGEEKLFKIKGTYGKFEGDQFEFDCAYIKPRYQPGEIVFLKEPYFIWEPEHCESMSKRFCYRFGLDKETEWFRKFEFEMGYEHYNWHNKMFMKADYARYFIQIKSVTAERLHDISSQDAVSEGVESSNEFNSNEGYLHQYKDYFKNDFEVDSLESYRTLWNKINGKDSYELNPWVWKYEFEIYKK